MTTRTPIRPSPPIPTPRRRLRPALAFGIPIAIAAIAVVAGLLLTGSGNGDEVITPTETTMPTQTTTPTTTPKATPATTTSTTVTQSGLPPWTWKRAEVPAARTRLPDDYPYNTELIGTGPDHVFATEDASWPNDRAVYASTTGTDWEKIEGLPDGVDILSITYGDGTYVAAGHLDLYTSENLEDWARVKQDPPLIEAGTRWGYHAVGPLITHGNDLFVAVGEGSTSPGGRIRPGLWVSPDGHEWSLIEDESGQFLGREDDSIVEFRDIAYGPAGFVMVGHETNALWGKGAIWHSPDGMQWSRRWVADAPALPGPFGIGYFYSVVHGDAGYVAVGGDGIWFSTNGLDWENIPIYAYVHLRDVVAVPDGYLAFGEENGPVVYHSPDGRTWEPMAESVFTPDEGRFLGEAAVTDTLIVVHGERLEQTVYDDGYRGEEYWVDTIWYAPLP